MFEASTGYPLANALWTMFVFFAWIVWIWFLFVIFSDLFSRHDVSGWAKAGWTVFVLVLPFLGVFVYLIAEGRGMAERRSAEARATQVAVDSHIRAVAHNGGGGPAQELSAAKELLDTGVINLDEYEQLKRKALAS